MIFIVLRFRARLRFFPMWQQALAVFALLLNDRIVVIMVRGFAGDPMPARGVLAVAAGRNDACGRSCSCCSTICADAFASAIHSLRIVASLLKPLKDTRQEASAFRRRALVGFLIIALCLVGLGARFAYLEITRHDEFALRSDSNRIVTRPLAPGARTDLRPQRRAARRQRRRVPARSDARAGQAHGQDAGGAAPGGSAHRR